MRQEYTEKVEEKPTKTLQEAARSMEKIAKTEGEERKLTVDNSIVEGLTKILNKNLVAMHQIGLKAE